MLARGIGFVKTLSKPSDVTIPDHQKLVAIDCEMVSNQIHLTHHLTRPPVYFPPRRPAN